MKPFPSWKKKAASIPLPGTPAPGIFTKQIPAMQTTGISSPVTTCWNGSKQIPKKYPKSWVTDG